jgi:hypothetical protein
MIAGPLPKVATLGIMTDAGQVDDPLAAWDPRRRAALARAWETFAGAGGDSVQLSDELIAERRAEAAIEDGPPLAG